MSRVAEHASHARAVVESCSVGSLATLATSPAGYPFVSVAPYALDDDGAPLLCLSDLAEHAQNLAVDPRAAILSTERAEDDAALASARVTVIGRCLAIEDPVAADAARGRYLARHPRAEYVRFKDFRMYRLDVEAVRYVGGFGSMSWVEPAAFLARP